MEDASILRALTEKYAELLGELRQSEDKAERLKVDIHHVEHVIRIYSANWNGDGVKPRRPSYPSRYLKVGQGVTTALDVLREATGPMTCREVVFAVMDRLAIPRDPKAVKSLESSIRFCLEKRKDSGIVTVEGRPRRYQVGITG